MSKKGMYISRSSLSELSGEGRQIFKKAFCISGKVGMKNI
jgi:hypothetical protein